MDIEVCVWGDSCDDLDCQHPCIWCCDSSCLNNAEPVACPISCQGECLTGGASDAPRDMKAALNSGIKPDTTHVRKSLRVYCARACEYGNDKYERANYLRPTGSVAKDFERLRAYLRAAQDHIGDALDSMELHQASDPNLEDVEGMKAAAYAADDESGLPHVSHAAASLNMAIEQAVQFNMLPKDPGQPWKDSK